MGDKDEARYVATSKGIEAGHRHQWIDSTRISDAGTRYECACGATYFEPMTNNMDLVYLRENSAAEDREGQRTW